MSEFALRAICVLSLTAITCAAAASSPGSVLERGSRADAPPARWESLADTPFEQYTHAAGLLATTAAAEDGAGFLWVGTQTGLVRWDGYHFRSYQPDPSRPGSLPDSFIRTLYTDVHGRLWVGMSSAGLAAYDAKLDRFVSYGSGPKGLSGVGVQAIRDDGAGGLWIGDSGGLDHLEPASGAVIRYTRNKAGGLPAAAVRAILVDRRGALWVGTAAGLVRRAANSKDFELIALPTSGAPPPAIRSLFEDSDGRIWIGTALNGAYVIKSQGAPPEMTVETGEHTSALATERIEAIGEPRQGEIWLGSWNEGIISIDTTSWRTRRIRHDPTLPTSLADDTVWNFHRDRAGLMWVCTSRGLGKLDPTRKAVLTVFGESGRENGISDSGVHAVLAAPNGSVWLGLGRRGVDILAPGGARSGEIRPDPTNPAKGLPKDFVNALLAMPDGTVFIGTSRGLYRADASGRHVARVAIAGRDPSGSIFALHVDADVLWIGGPDGLWRLDVGGHAAGKADHMAVRWTDQRIRVIEQAQAGALWIGTENGLNRLDVHDGTVERILPNPRAETALAAGFVSALLNDGQGRLWVGTVGGGINILERDDARGAHFRRLGLAQNFPNTNVDKLLLGAGGNIVASTDEGLAVIDPKTFAVHALGRAEGVEILSYWANSGAITHDGDMIFGGVGGLTIVRPGEITGWDYRPPIVVTDVRVGGRPADLRNTLAIAPEANSVAVEFAALDYSAPERNRYAYRLRGYDPHWVETDAAHRVAAYTNLPPGDYELELKGSNRDGLWSQKTLTLPLKVAPAWYQTVWFKLVSVLTGSGAILGIIQARTVFLRARRRALLAKVAERTAELQHSQRELEKIAYFDPLTQLPNRRKLKTELARLIAAAEPFALLLIDLDRFKRINDSLGHEAGDELLREMAARLRGCTGDDEIVVRLGGDEFVVLLPALRGKDYVTEIASRILRAAALPFGLLGQEFRVSASIGISLFPEGGSNERLLMKNADIAMYRAKELGKNNFQLYTSDLNANALERLNIESALRHAIEDNEFELQYRARRDIGDGQVTGMEAVLRWRHPVRGRIDPADFMPVAEETGLIVPIGRWALRAACVQNMAWQAQGLPRLVVAISLTARQFGHERVIEDIKAILDSTAMDPRLLEIQVTEAVLVRHAETTLRVLTTLKSLGVRIAINDFGTGYTSLTRLQRFPLDTVKIEPAFVRAMGGDTADRGLARALIAVGRNLSMAVVAHGVETQELNDFLRANASEMLQGFYFNRSMSAAEFEELLQEQKFETADFGTRAALFGEK